MQVRHNTTLLEQAIALVVQRASIPTKQAEADAAAKHARAVAYRRIATGAAIAAAAIGIGLGVMLGFWKHSDQRVVAEAPLPPSPSQQLPSPSQQSATAPPTVPSPVTTADTASTNKQEEHTSTPPPLIDYSKFATQTINSGGRSWEISAGHQYATETDKIWKYAWCYSNQVGDGGALLRVDLAKRDSPIATPTALIASPETLAKVNLTGANAIELATKCPWLDGKTFGTNEFATPPGRPATAEESPNGSPHDQGTATSPGPPIDLNPGNSRSPGSGLDQSTMPPAPGSIEAARFISQDGYDALGNDLDDKPIMADDKQDCENSCRKDHACSAYTFNKTFKKCFLKKVATVLFSNKVATVGYRMDRGLAPRLSKLQTHPSRSLAGDVYRRDSGVQYIDCVLQCENDLHCRAFSYDTKAKLCRMFRSTTSEIDMPNISSGVKTGG